MDVPVISIRIQPLVTAVTNSIVDIDQNEQERFYTSAIRRLVRKLDRRLLPFLVLLEISSFINQVSMGTSFSLPLFAFMIFFQATLN